MMNNLFTNFDPSTNIFNLPLNWLSIFIMLMIMPKSYWLLKNNYFLIYNKCMNILNNEFKIIMNNKKMNNSTLILNSMFFFIMFSNMLGLFPYIFSNTSHLLMNLTLALPIWLSFLIYSWIKKTKKMFIHLVPQGTPNMLIPFMVCIETISNIIRPLTLTIRLAANMIAGHLLLTLLGNTINNLDIIFMHLMLLVQFLLFMLELAVAIIQSYVFSILITLYSSEV